MDTANPPVNTNAWAVSVRPAEDGLLLRARSGGGRRPENGHFKLIHSNATSFLDSWAAAYHDSAALELRLALFLERLYAFICIVRHEHAPDRFALDGEPKVERPAIALRDRKLGMADRDARAGGELGGVLDRARTARGRVGEEPVDDAGFFRARRVERGGVGDQVQAPGQPDQAGQPLRAARPGKQPEIHLGQPDLVRALGGEPQVAGKRELEALGG